jgi:uncharacterized Tic20 family protein
MNKLSDILYKVLVASMVIVVLGVYLPSLVGLEIEMFSILLGFIIVFTVVANLIIWIYQLVKHFTRKS